MDLIEVTDPAQLEAETVDASLKSLYGYWTDCRGALSFPSRGDIDPVDFAYALGRVSLIDVLADPQRFRYRLVSTSLTRHLGYEMTHKFVDDIPELEMRRYVIGLYQAAVARRAPLLFRHEIALDERFWTSEGLILPLSSDGSSIDLLMVYRATNNPGPPKRGSSVPSPGAATGYSPRRSSI